MLEETPNWKEEFTKPNRARSDTFANYVSHGDFDSKNVPLTFIAYEWVNGESLRRYVNSRRANLDIPFIITFAKWILTPLSKLRQAKGAHGDLHMGNIMVTQTGDQDIPPRQLGFKLIDFGVSASIVGLPARDDYQGLAVILAQMLKEVRRDSLELSEHFQFDKLTTSYLKMLTDDDPSRNAKDPKSLWNELDSILSETQRIRAADGEQKALRSPFEILSADRFSDDSPLLKTLFARAVPGFETLESNDTILLTGPRGCGKTMMLRNMATRSYLTKKDIRIEELPDYLAFYLSSFELLIAFPRRKTDDERKPEDIADDAYKGRTAHYFHLCWLSEVASTLEQLQNRFGDVAISIAEAVKLVDFVNSSFAEEILPVTSSPLQTLRAAAERWRASFYQKPTQGKEGPGFLRDLCRTLRALCPVLRGRRIFFLLDDYSLGRISEALQLSINRIVFQRQAEFVFKIAAEKEAVLMRDTDAALEPGRTHSELDLGHFFISPDSADHRIRLLRDVFNNRLKSTTDSKYQDIELILGKTNYNNFSQFARMLIGKEIPNTSPPEYLKKPYYHGIQHLAEICSGDVAAMISLVQRILQESQFDISSPGQGVIPWNKQDSAIKNFSRNFLEQVGGEQRWSAESRAVAKAFGEMAQWKLLNQNSTNESRETPFQAARLEVYVDSAMDESILPLYKALLRYGVFIQEPRGFGQGETLSYRLYLRRLFLPTFGLSFSRRDCIRLHMRDFIELLRSPDLTKQAKILRWTNRDAENPRQPLLIQNPDDSEFD